MIDREQFARLVREALPNLYEPELLAANPLRGLLVSENEPMPTDALQRILFEAIHQLMPSRGSPQYHPRLRRYQQLCLRYLESVDPPMIADRLGIGERQLRRDHQEALDTLVSILWGRYSRLRWTSGRQVSGEVATQSDQEALDSELRRIISAPTQGPVSLLDVVESVLATLARLAERQRVALQVSLPRDLPSVAMDRIVLRQILVSSLVYAIGGEHTERVVLAARDEGQRLRVQITAETASVDSGSPAEPESPARSTSPAGGDLDRGTRNALAASARLVELQGGSFELIGQSPQGEQILLSLPRAPLTTVLVVDDNPDFVRLFRRYLGDSPYRVIQVGVAAEALEVARASEPDVITLDVMMPAQDGWEILQELKGNERTRHIPVLVCSVMQEPTLALSLGAAGFLAKPITRQALLSALERCVRVAHRGSS